MSELSPPSRSPLATVTPEPTCRLRDSSPGNSRPHPQSPPTLASLVPGSYFLPVLRPHISLNFALSADGRITSVAGISSGWTSQADKDRLLHLRRSADAILVGRGTLEADRMTMTAPQNPLRCVVSGKGRFDPTHPLFHTPGGPIHLLGIENPPEPVGEATLHHASLADFLGSLHRDHGIRHLHCEGGGTLVRALAEMDAIDEIHLTWAAHTLFGGRSAPGLAGPPGDFLPASRRFELTDFDPRSELGECFLTYRRVSAAADSSDPPSQGPS